MAAPTTPEPYYPCTVPESPFPWIGIDRPRLPGRLREFVTRRDRVLVWGGMRDRSITRGFDECALISLGTAICLARTRGASGHPATRWDLVGMVRSGPSLVPDFTDRVPIPVYAGPEIYWALLRLEYLTRAP